MKHYRITRGARGWTKATITLPNGTTESFDCFYNADEARIWCFAKIRRYYGANVANAEFAR